MIDIAMNLNNGFSGTYNLKTENYVRAYAETMEALKFDFDGPKIQCKVFEDHFHFFRSYFNTEGQCLNALS